MTKQTQINFIVSKCIEANPEIVALKFGCRTRRKLKLGNAIDGTVISFDHMGKVVDGVALPDYDRIRIYEGGEVNDFRAAQETIEPLGRPIRLADVLLAIGSRAKDFELRNDYLWSWSVDVPKYNDDRANQIFWNLRADDLRDQSDETINFIYNLVK